MFQAWFGEEEDEIKLEGSKRTKGKVILRRQKGMFNITEHRKIGG